MRCNMHNYCALIRAHFILLLNFGYLEGTLNGIAFQGTLKAKVL